MKDEIKEILELLKYCVEKNEYLEVPNMKEWKPLLDYITNLQEENQNLKIQVSAREEEYMKLQEENEEIKMTNLALADDITKNKIIKQEVLTECCGIPIGEIPMLKIQNDEYKQRIYKAIEYMNNYNELVVPDANIKSLILKEEYKKIINLLQGKSDE